MHKCSFMGVRCQNAAWLVTAQYEAWAVSCSNAIQGVRCAILVSTTLRSLRDL